MFKEKEPYTFINQYALFQYPKRVRFISLKLLKIVSENSTNKQTQMYKYIESGDVQTKKNYTAIYVFDRIKGFQLFYYRVYSITLNMLKIFSRSFVQRKRAPSVVQMAKVKKT